MSKSLNNQQQPTQQYRQLLVSVFNLENVVMKTQFNIAVSIQVTVSSGIPHFLSTDSHPSALRKEEVSHNPIKKINFKTSARFLRILSVLLVAANNCVQVWQNLHNNKNLSPLYDPLSSIEKVRLDYRENK